jgi:hypothetical protein
MFSKKIKMYKFSFMLLAALSLTANHAYAEMQGVVEAITMANTIVESIGGKPLWAEIRSLHVIEKSRSLGGDGIIGEFWRDLIEPRDRYTLNSPEGPEVEFWWDERGVYQFIDNNRQELSPDLHSEVQSYWHGEIYVMFGRFARDDSDLFLHKNEDNSFTASSVSLDKEIGTFWVNGDGDLYRWRHEDGTEYIYGPHKQFGEISFPDWGTQIDGSWSFYYVEIEPSNASPSISFDPP